LALRKRLPAYSNIQVAALTSGNMTVFLLFSETNRASRFSPLCVAMKPQKPETTWSVIEDVKAALISTKIHGTRGHAEHNFHPHFLTIQKHALENDYGSTIKQLSSLVLMYCGFLLDKVTEE